jgi:hypothetical protein
MVSAKNEEVLGIFNFVGKQKADCLQALFSSVDVVSKEQVVGFRRETAILKQTEQVVVLAVNITCRQPESEWDT